MYYSKMMKERMRRFASHRSSNKSLKLILQHSNEIIVGSLASEFQGWSWKTHVGIPMLDIGIPM